MNEISPKIIKFIEKHHVLTLATSVNNHPYCANCFYVYNKVENAFIFTSSDETKHARDALANPKVAASVVLETGTVGKIQGLQITGKMFRPDKILLKTVKKQYLTRFPVAKLMDIDLWVLRPDFLKYTDNRLGFGKKLIWTDQIATSE